MGRSLTVEDCSLWPGKVVALRRQQLNIVAGKGAELNGIRMGGRLHHAAVPTIVAHFDHVNNIAHVNLQFVRILWSVIVEHLTSERHSERSAWETKGWLTFESAGIYLE